MSVRVRFAADKAEHGRLLLTVLANTFKSLCVRPKSTAVVTFADVGFTYLKKLEIDLTPRTFAGVISFDNADRSNFFSAMLAKFGAEEHQS